MKKNLFSIALICCLLFTSCQTETPANENFTINQIDSEQQESVSVAPTKTPEPSLEPNDSPIPSPQPTATLDPMKIGFGTKPYEFSNLKGGGPVLSIAWHPDASLFANSGYQRILVWETKTTTHAFILEGHNDVIIELEWSPDGSILASLGLDETLRLWKAPEYQEVEILETGAALSMDWAADSQHLAVGTDDGKIQIWDVQTGEVQNTWQFVEPDPIFQLDWSPDETKFATGHTTGKVVVWDANTGEQLQTLLDTQDSPAADLAWAPNGSYLATAHLNGQVHLWGQDNFEKIRTMEALDAEITKIAWSPDSLILAVGGATGYSVELWEAETGEWIRGVGMPNTIVWSMVWSPNGKFLTIGTGGRGFPSRADIIIEPNEEAGVIYLWVRK